MPAVQSVWRIFLLTNICVMRKIRGMDMRSIRKRRGLTLVEVARAVGADPGNLSRIERGQQTPRYELAVRLWNFYNGEIPLLQILAPDIEVAA